jgi:MFS family permease
MTGGLLASRTLVSLLGAPLAGVWSDAVGRRWELLALSMAAGAIGVGLMAFPNLVVVIVGTMVGAAASGSIQALSTALAGDLSGGKYQGSNLGILYTTGDLGSAIGPLAAYALLGEGGLPVIYVGSAVLMIVVAVWTASIR